MLSTRMKSLEFVICDESKTKWDNPPVDFNNPNADRNYRIPLDSNVEHRYCLLNGRVTFIPKMSPIVLVTDLDGTLLGNEYYLGKFNDIWTRQHMFNGSKLIYSTGRNLKDFLLVSKQCDLLKPDFAICGVGTEIYEFPGEPLEMSTYRDYLRYVLKCEKESEASLSAVQKHYDMGEEVNFDDEKCPRKPDTPEEQENSLFPEWCPSRLFARPVERWFGRIKESFDREEVERETKEILNKNNLNHYVNGNNFHDPFRLSMSIYTRDANEAFDLVIQANKKNYKYAISGQGEWKYLDILPEIGGKRSSIMFVFDEILKKEIPLSRFLVCGDSGNDAHMFSINESKNCCVVNAQQDLKDFLLSNKKTFKSVLRQSEELGVVFLSDNSSENSGGLNLNTQPSSCENEQSELLKKIMNAQNLGPPDEVFMSTFPNAGGIVQALMHYCFVSNSHLP
ncbi:sucrose-phosphatase-like HAD superfamily hydrolase [Cryptosporidium ryanae]|uniref:sucrose-phosphatase-like HAD superfamily hydrolase n=1 Tax=Cryptosporidium ryanae TaxID=515981 RepID=UPI003519E5E9|nr:sucrose-phosphatase-like HAD superfamily hydrolase [Cryptosporidium ryanae]